MNFFKYVFLFLFMSSSCIPILAQEATDTLTMPESPDHIQYVEGAFRATRVLNGHSNKLLSEGLLDFRVEHRFGRMNQGYYEFFGLDQASTFFSLEYGIKNGVMLGLNRSSLDKTVSGFAKIGVFRQSIGTRKMPVSVSILLETSIDGTKWVYPDRDNLFSSRVSYASQLIVARKFTDHFSLQLAPLWIHRNLVPTKQDKNDVFVLGMASSYGISNMVSINAEYYPVVSSSWNHQNKSNRNALSFGFDIDTGGHVFQLMLSNSTGMIEKTFTTETTGNWLKGDLHLGFNISRLFSIK